MPLPSSPKPEPPRAANVTPIDDELDELDELPPMDGDIDEPATDGASEDEELDDVSEEGDPFDDSTGEDDPVDDDLEIDESERGWLDDAGEAEGLDIGMPDLGGPETEAEKSDLAAGAEETGLEDDDFSLGGDESQPGVDAGEEGFETEDEDLREEDLPRMDAGDDGEMDDAQLVEAWMIAPDDEARPVWSVHLWGPAGAPMQLGAGAVEAIACAGRVVIAVSASPARLTRVDLEGGAEPIEALGLRGGDVRGIFAEGSRVLVATARAGILMSTDGGATFVEANGWRACVTRNDADAPLDLVAKGDAMWGRTRSGVLVASRDGGTTWRAIASEMRVAAIAADGAGAGGLIALAMGGLGIARARVEDGDGDRLTWSAAAALPEAAEGDSDEGAEIAIAARGDHVAVCMPGRGIYRRAPSASGVVTWERVEGTASASTCAIIDDAGTLLAALYSLTEERAWLAKCDAPGLRSIAPAPAQALGAPAAAVATPSDAALEPSAKALLVAEIGEASEDADARVHALVWDDAHGVAWAAGGFGLVALAPREERL